MLATRYSAMRKLLVLSALCIASGAIAPVAALDIGVGDISVSVGTDSGLDVGIGVGSTADVGVSVGPSGVAAGVGLGTGAGSTTGVGVSVGTSGVAAGIGLGTGTAGTSTTTSVTLPRTSLSGPSREEVRAASSRECTGTGNSSVYDNYIVYDQAGLAIGVVKSANVGTDLRVQRLTVSTLDSFVNPAQCLTLTDQNLQIGAGAMRLSLSGNFLLRAIASK